MLQTSQQYRIQRTQGSQQPYIARVLYQISRKPRSVHLTVSWSKHHHRFQAEFSPARCGFIADNGVCATKQKRSRGRPPAGGRLFSLKVIIRRVKTSMRPGQANIFKPPLCAKRFSFPPPLPSPPLLHPFHLFVCCVAAAGRGAQLPGMTLRIGCFDGNNVSAWNYDSPFRRGRSGVTLFARCLLRAWKIVEKRARERFFLFFFPGFDFYSMINMRN